MSERSYHGATSRSLNVIYVSDVRHNDYIYVSICGFVYFVVIVYLVFVVCSFVCLLFIQVL